MFIFSSEQIINKPLDEVFDFFKNPKNLGKLTPDWLNFKIMHFTDSEMRENSKFTYKIKLFLFSFKWYTLITKYEAPKLFVDSQIKGPYKKWIHTHTFEQKGNSTIIRDNVEYDLYGGPLKYFINKIFIEKTIMKIFIYRKKSIDKIFG